MAPQCCPQFRWITLGRNSRRTNNIQPQVSLFNKNQPHSTRHLANKLTLDLYDKQ
jgi:hypothetical protein